MKNFTLKNAKILSICLGAYYLLNGLVLGFILIIKEILFEKVPELSQIKEAGPFISMIVDILNINLPLSLFLGFAFVFFGIFIAKVQYKFYTSLALIAVSLFTLVITYIKVMEILDLLHAQVQGSEAIHMGIENFAMPILTFLAPQGILAWGLWTIEHKTEEVDPLEVV